MKHCIFTLILTLIPVFTLQAERSIELDALPTPSEDIMITKIGEHIYQIVGKGGNMLVVVNPENGHLLVINSKFKETLIPVKNALNSISHPYLHNKEQGYIIDILIYSNYHPDNIGGNMIAYDQYTKIYAHPNTLKRMEQDGVMPEILPTHLVKKKTKIKFYKEPIEIIYHYPAHSSADLVVIFPQRKILVLAGLLFTNKYPNNFDPNGNVANLQKIYDIYSNKRYKDYTYIPGHQPSLANTDGYLISYQQYIALTSKLKTAYDLVQKHKQSGNDLLSFDLQQLNRIFPQYGNAPEWVASFYPLPPN